MLADVEHFDDAGDLQHGADAGAGGGVRGSLPKMRTLPVVGEASPSMRRTAVVFPAPLGPSSATTSPGWRDSERPSSAVVEP